MDEEGQKVKRKRRSRCKTDLETLNHVQNTDSIKNIWKVTQLLFSFLFHIFSFGSVIFTFLPETQNTFVLYFPNLALSQEKLLLNFS